MANNTQDLLPYVRVATVYGVVALRRSTSGLWAGRGLKKLECAKGGFLTGDKEKLEWRKIKNECVVCWKPTTLTVQWEGPGSGKPLKPEGAIKEIRRITPKPVKVMDAYVCGYCRVQWLPRLKIITQWDIQMEDASMTECTCHWDGDTLHDCVQCGFQFQGGRLLRIEEAKGWQVRRFIDPLQPFRTTPPLDSWAAPSDGYVNQAAAEGTEAQELSEGTPSAPVLDLGPYCNICDGAADEETPHNDRLKEAIRQGWPFSIRQGQVSCLPLDTIQVPMVMRVYRDPALPDSRTGLEYLREAEREQAHAAGWDGPWELTNWGRLIKEVLTDPKIPTEELPPVPREDGARSTNLYYCVTGLDAWGSSGANARKKSAVYLVTPEAWYRNRVLQVPGARLDRAATPIRPDHTRKVKITVQMVTVPYKGIYSVGADVEIVGETPLPKAVSSDTEKAPRKRFRDWFKRSLSGGDLPKNKKPLTK